ncbi:MAG TPA: hypothetical protein PKA64_16180, partial [Myxococcota bacterium]|nr:hypothetical protein [Myxococcota bacterium]
MAPRTTRGGWGRRQALCAVCWLPPAVASGAESRELAPGLWLDHWPESDGLPSDALYSLAIDDRGRLVMGSGDGVGFFDGVRFSVQRRGDPVAPPDDRVFWVGTGAADGALWLVTESGSAQRRLGGAVTDFGPLVDHAPTIRTSFDGPVPLVYTGKGVFELRDRPVKREDLPDAVSFPVSDEAGTWVRTLHDDLLLRPRGASAFRPATPEDGAPPPWDPPPNELASAADDVVSWRGQRVYEATKPILALRVADGEAWIATQGDGLLRLRESPMRLERGPDPEDVWVGSIVADPVAGTIWAARPWDRGWWSVDRPGHPAAFAGFVAEDPADGQPRLLPVGVPGHGRWWFLTGNLHRQTSPEGAPQLRLGPPEQRACEPSPAAIHRSSDGRIYASGLVWDGDRWRPTPDGCGEPWTGVRAMADLPGEGVLVAAEARLTLLPFDGSAPRALSQPANARPRHLRVAEGFVWLATEQDGLC